MYGHPGRRTDRVATPERLRRVVAFTFTSTLLSSLAHAAAGGALPDLWLLLLGALAIGGLTYPLLRREMRWPAILLGLVSAQALLHGWLVVTAGQAHSHDQSHAGGSDARMLLAHAAATLLAAGLLRHAEGVVWQRARRAWIAALLDRTRWLPLPPIRQPAGSAGIRSAVTPLPPQALVPAFGVRGPPMLVCP